MCVVIWSRFQPSVAEPYDLCPDLLTYLCGSELIMMEHTRKGNKNGIFGTVKCTGTEKQYSTNLHVDK
jgi:hypothetical protein